MLVPYVQKCILQSVRIYLFVSKPKGLSLIQLKSTRFQKSNTSQRRHYFQCPCTVCQHLWHIFYHNLYLQFCTQLKKSSLWLLKYIDAVIKTVIIQKRETKQNKTFKHRITIEFQPPSSFILIFGIWNLKVLHLLLLHCCYCLQQNNSDSVC